MENKLTIRQSRKSIAEINEDILELLDNCRNLGVDLGNIVNALEEVIDTAEWADFLEKDSFVSHLKENKIYPEYFTLNTAELTNYLKQAIIESIEKGIGLPTADFSDEITKTQKSGKCGSVDCACKTKKNKKK